MLTPAIRRPVSNYESTHNYRMQVLWCTFRFNNLYRDEKLLRTDCTDTCKLVHHYHPVDRTNTVRTQKTWKEKHTLTWNKNKMADSVLFLMIIIS